MRYMLMIHLTDEGIAELERGEHPTIMDVHEQLQRELKASGELVDTHELLPDDAKIVRATGSDVLVTDGPFTESKEWIAGYYIVDCASMDRATEIAGRLIEAQMSPVEVRVIR